MITLRLQPTDIEQIRFAYSPLIELVCAYRVLRKSEGLWAKHACWIDRVSPLLEGVSFPYMDAVISSACYIVDFVTPTPEKTARTIEEQFAEVRATPTAVILDNMRKIIGSDGNSPERAHFLAYPHDALDCLLEEMRLFWHTALEADWSRIATALENDVLYHARVMALQGVEDMFCELSQRICYHAGVLRLLKDPSQHAPNDNALAGDGMRLVPTVFGSDSILWQIADPWLPMIIYSARGAGTWMDTPRIDGDSALATTLGAGRARLLTTLRTPLHTTELARSLELTPGAVSQMLSKMHAAGLVEPSRVGARVYYRLSGRGEKLLDIFE